MEIMMAYCGLRCDSCPIHLATIEPDQLVQRSMRESIAKECSTLYGMKLEPGDVADCDGCRAGGRLFAGCSTCEVRKCDSHKNRTSCALCMEYACQRLMNLFAIAPEARTRLEEIRTVFNQHNNPELR